MRDLVTPPSFCTPLLDYARSVDTRNWRLFEDCFTPDATARYRDRNFHDRDELVSHMERIHRKLDGSLHRLSNVQVLAAAADRLQVVSYVDALLVHRAHSAGPTYQVVGRYTDVLRWDERWLIQHRSFDETWSVGDRGILAT